jgi:cyclohexa-1,5-dienecarbonyl-CoA hydratase
MPKVRFSSDANAYRITLDDPPLHILDIAMLAELRDALGRVANDRHALIIDATGDKAFSAGASVQDHLGDRVVTMLANFHDCFRALARLDLVTVAFVRGPALGGGCELAMACDFVLASDRARFALPEITLGVFPPVAAYQMSRQVPPRIGLEAMLTGDPIDARFVTNAIFAHDEFDARADERVVAALREESVSHRARRRLRRAARARRTALSRGVDEDRRCDRGIGRVHREAERGVARQVAPFHH